MFENLSKSLFVSLIISAALISLGCGAEAVKTRAAETPAVTSPRAAGATNNSETLSYSRPATIEITQGSPADAVRTFYAYLKEKKIREALFLTNLRPAIEGLTDAELADLQMDFEPIAKAIPADVEINGEIVSGNYATVTAKLPDNETREIKVQEIRLRKESNYWVILTVDEEAEAVIKKEGNRYFFNLKIQTHEAEAKAMMERIHKAQMVFAYQYGSYGDLAQLVSAGLLPEDAQGSESTGYNFRISISEDKSKYFATGEPAVYGKTGRVSYLLEADSKGPRLTFRDNKGKPLKK